MSGIHRVSVRVADYQELDIDGPVISVAADRDGRSDVLDLWFESGGPTEGLTAIYVFGTGHPTPWNGYTRHGWQFIGTVITPSGLVWHVYHGPCKGEAIAV